MGGFCVFFFCFFFFFWLVWVGFVSPFFHFQNDELCYVFLVQMVSGDFKVHLFLSFSLFGGRVGGGTNRIFLFWSSPPPPKKNTPTSGVYFFIGGIWPNFWKWIDFGGLSSPKVRAKKNWNCQISIVSFQCLEMKIEGWFFRFKIYIFFNILQPNLAKSSLGWQPYFLHFSFDDRH